MSTLKLLPAILLGIVVNNVQAQDVLKAHTGSSITVQNGATIVIKGDVNLADGSQLVNSGTITTTLPTTGTANFVDNTIVPYNYGIGKFIFTGSGIQTISSPNQFERIDVDNAGLSLGTNIKANTWYLKAGKITTGAFTAIATSVSTTAVQADAVNTNFSNSWFNGNLRRYISPATVDNYQFPVGDATKVNMAELDNLMAIPLTGVNYINSSFGPKPGNDLGLNVTENAVPYTSVNNGGVWYLTPDANPVSGQYDIKLYFNGFTGLTDNNFGPLRRPDASANAAEWIVPAGSTLPAAGSPGRIIVNGFARRNNISSFSQWGIGVFTAPLPLQLLSFYAVKKDRSVLLQWTTTNEINTSHFELYKGAQPSSLQYLDKVSAAGLSATNRNYNYADLKPLKGLNFYQLKMVDKDNSFKLSETVKINFNDINTLAVYPNPVSNNVLLVEYTGGKVKDISLIAADGKQISCSFTAQTNNRLKVLIPAIIAKGAYTLQLITEDGIRNTNLLVQ